jgi:NADH-quinone oxidoreductase subunit H
MMAEGMRRAIPFWADAASRFRSPLTSAPQEVPWFSWLFWAVVFFGLFPGIMAYFVWAERKVAARFQDRIGPNRVGPLGLLQSIADAVKLITKENIVPSASDRWIHFLAPVLLLVSAFLSLAVIPFGVGLAAVNLPSGLLFLVAVSSLSPLSIFLAGWSSRNKFSLLGAMRAVAQLVSYEVPQVLATVPVILWAGSLSLVTIFDRQVDLGWFLFSPPGLLAFVILTIANIAEVNRAPFDLPEAESEIVAGYHTEYSGMKFALFFLAEYLGIFAISCLGTALFLGGGTLPFVGSWQVNAIGLDEWPEFVATNVVATAIFAFKVGAYVFLIFWIRATLPRLRVDRLMDFAWKILVPLGLANIPIAAVWYELAIRPEAPNRLLAWLVTAPLTLGAVVAVFALHRGTRKIPLIPAPRVARPLEI